MAITLRDNTVTNTGKGTELTYLEMDTNLESFYYSSSYSSGVISLYTTGSDTHSIDLSGFVDDLETGSLLRLTTFNTATGSFVTTASATTNVVTFTKGDGTTFSITVDTGSGVGGSTDYVSNVALNGTDLEFTGIGSAFNSVVDLSSLTGGGTGVQPSETASFYYSSSVNLNTITFFQGDGSSEAVTVDTGSVTGGATSPGGSNTHIQFNQLGSFGGESALTYTSASQTLTIDKSTAVTAASPNLKLLGNSSNIGDLSGVIAASATTQNSAPASLQFRNATSHGLGNYDTDVLIKTAFAGGGGTTVERTALTLSASGDAYFSYDIFAPNLDNTSQANLVGFNSSTGELTYFNSSSVVEQAFTLPTTSSYVADADSVSLYGLNKLYTDLTINYTGGTDKNFVLQSAGVGSNWTGGQGGIIVADVQVNASGFGNIQLQYKNQAGTNTNIVNSASARVVCTFVRLAEDTTRLVLVDFVSF